MVIDEAKLKKYFKGDLRHPFYEKSVEMAHEIAIHMDGMYPVKLIDERRPSESVFIKEYRKKIWEPITQDPIGQVVNELMKIRKADDWSVRYDVNAFSSKIRPDERPSVYFEERFPVFKSVTNWTFSVLLPIYLKDPNAVLLTLPMEKVDDMAAYNRPFPFLFEADQVLECNSEIAILSAQRKLIATEEDMKNPNFWKVSRKGDVYYVIDKTEYVKYRQLDEEGTFEIVEQFSHKLGYQPAFKLKAMFKDQKAGDFLWKSRLSNMVARLNEAVREYSDLQAEVVQHVHSEKWVIATQKCNSCNGSGKVRQGNPIEIITCPQCSGSGTVATSPYNNLVVDPPKKLDGQSVFPIPPAGYIQKQVEIVKIQDERVDKHIYKALCAVSMQYLDKSPIAQSGISKEVDKDSLNNFVNSVAEDMVRIMDEYYRVANDMRYKAIVPGEADRKAMLPKVSVPTKLDILSAGYLVDEVKKLKDGNVNPLIIVATEMELANKKFASDPGIRDMVTTVFRLDPLAGISQDDKMSMLQNRGITTEDYVISCNIHRLVQMATDENPKFYTLSRKDQMAKIKELAKEMIQNAKPQVRTTVDPEPQA